MSVNKAKGSFFKKADRFAVVGASKDRSKYGNKVLRWYIDRGFDVVPVHPKEASVEEKATVASVSELQQPATTALSIITPPSVSLGIVKTALFDLNVSGVWLQPGAEDKALIEWVESQDDAVKDKVVYGGPCILVLGDDLAKAQGKL